MSQTSVSKSIFIDGAARNADPRITRYLSNEAPFLYLEEIYRKQSEKKKEENHPLLKDAIFITALIHWRTLISVSAFQKTTDIHSRDEKKQQEEEKKEIERLKKAWKEIEQKQSKAEKQAVNLIELETRFLEIQKNIHTQYTAFTAMIANSLKQWKKEIWKNGVADAAQTMTQTFANPFETETLQHLTGKNIDQILSQLLTDKNQKNKVTVENIESFKTQAVQKWEETKKQLAEALGTRGAPHEVYQYVPQLGSAFHFVYEEEKEKLKTTLNITDSMIAIKAAEIANKMILTPIYQLNDSIITAGSVGVYFRELNQLAQKKLGLNLLDALNTSSIKLGIKYGEVEKCKTRLCDYHTQLLVLSCSAVYEQAKLEELFIQKEKIINELSNMMAQTKNKDHSIQEIQSIAKIINAKLDLIETRLFPTSKASHLPF